MTDVSIPRLMPLSEHSDHRGALLVYESKRQFERIYLIKDVPRDQDRGHHAHLTLWQAIIAICGSFEVHLYRPEIQYSFKLDCDSELLLVPPGYWRVLREFSAESKCLVLASSRFAESDYIHDFEEFVTWVDIRGQS